jgi:hypothetical protein
MRTLAVALLGGVAALVAVAADAGAQATRLQETKVTVAPARGAPSTRFVLRFDAPQRTGRELGLERRYELSVSGPGGARGCVSGASEGLPFTRRHQRVRVVLDPARLGGKWCAGSFKGRIEEIESPVCMRGTPCPEFVALLGTIGKFRFAVVPAPGAGVAPVFAGIKSSLRSPARPAHSDRGRRPRSH